MTSTKPYLVRAIHEWALDNNLTPQILVSDSVEGVKVPQNYIKDGHIVFNIHINAVKDLNLTNEWIFFSARFAGKAMDIEVPIDAVLAIYARENGQGIFFQDEEPSPPPEEKSKSVTDNKDTADPKPQKSKDSKSHLKLVK